jgi:hypothetical protein
MPSSAFPAPDIFPLIEAAGEKFYIVQVDVWKSSKRIPALGEGKWGACLEGALDESGAKGNRRGCPKDSRKVENEFLQDFTSVDELPRQAIVPVLEIT